MHTDEFAGILQVDDIDFSKYLAETNHAEKVRSARDFYEQTMEVLVPPLQSARQPRMPFAGAWLDFRPGEVTVWGGYNGSGKSLLQGQVIADLCESGATACIASMEMKPGKTLARMAKQIERKAVPSASEVQNFLTRNKGRLWLYDQQGTVKSEHMIAVIKHCAEELKCQHVAVDSLMKCIKGAGDYDAQKNFVDELTAAARDFNPHIHLVAHFKKPDEDSHRMPTRYDLKGASEISDLADNVVIVWRNKKKERDIEQGKEVDCMVPDAILLVDKQRNGDGWEGRVKLWFDPLSGRYYDINTVPQSVLMRGTVSASEIAKNAKGQKNTF
jgi:twinkle protein